MTGGRQDRPASGPESGARGPTASERALADHRYQEALDQLHLVNEIFVRSRRYRNLPGASGIVAGSLALAGGSLFAVFFGTADAAPGAFVLTWTAVFVLALSAHVLFSLRNANRRMEPLISEVALLLAQTIVPVQIVGIVVPIVLYRAGDIEHLAGFWMLFYGVGVLSCRPYVDSWVGWFGWSFLILGSLHLLVWPASHNGFMTFGFGLTHIIYGFGLTWADARRNRFSP